MTQKIALISALGLGDGLLLMTVVNNLTRYGYDVTLFNDHLLQLREWFPQRNIVPFPDISNAEKLLKPYDKIISTDAVPLFKIKMYLGDKYHIFYRREFDKNKSMVLNFLDKCQALFPMKEIVLENNIVVPSNLQNRKNINRVIVHPMSSNPKKNWPAEKFMRLAEKLAEKNFEPVFIVSPAERPEWETVVTNKFSLPLFPNLDLLARFVYESGYMIGNDSGIGHLASNLNIPSVTLYARKSVANLWRPIWAKNIVVTPTITLPSGSLRMKYWKQLLTVTKVLRSFERIL